MAAGLCTDMVKVGVWQLIGTLVIHVWFSGLFDVEDIDPFLCTHLVYGFAGLNPVNLTIESLDPYNDLYDNWGRGAFDRLLS